MKTLAITMLSGESKDFAKELLNYKDKLVEIQSITK